MKLEQAARQALEALELIANVNAMDYEYQRWAKTGLTALRKALADSHKQNCACEVCRGCDNADIKAEQVEQEPNNE